MPVEKIGKGIYHDYLDEFEEAAYYAKQKDKPDAGITARAIRTTREGREARVQVTPPTTSTDTAEPSAGEHS